MAMGRPNALVWCGRTLACVAMTLTVVSAQDSATQQPVFRSGAQLTVVDVTVTDKAGHPIEGLTANDFLLSEDGVPQAISLVAFQRIDRGGTPTEPAVPSPPPARTARAAPTVQPQIASAPAGDVRYQNRRLVVLYFDLSAMPPLDQSRAYTAARKFL